MNDITLKASLYEFCREFIGNRIERIVSQMKEVQEALESETKSSAGDKHETGRAMLQLEREKLGHQLAEAENMGRLLKKVTIVPIKKTASLGSLVKTSKANYFLAISAGEYTSAKEKHYCISLQTPIAKLLLGKTVGETFDLNGEEIRILGIS